MPPLLSFPSLSLSFSFSDYQDGLFCQSPKQEKNTVSFFEHALVYDHWSRGDFTPEERSRIWYSKKALYDIQYEAYCTTLQMVECREEIECSRGLEQKTPAGSTLRHRHRQEALSAVIQAQEDQWLALKEHLDPEPIAKAYSRFTNESTKVAALMAAIDQETVEDDLPTPRAKTMGLAQRGELPESPKRRSAVV
eukprot:scaffold1843_cov87-Cylindrotheca_fusiformis.AAC.6